jgi:hypothetical protein
MSEAGQEDRGEASPVYVRDFAMQRTKNPCDVCFYSDARQASRYPAWSVFSCRADILGVS